ncbi:MAG: hypothetical protein K2K16_11125 [Ruminococcus sp.]|nr:hypothetical protein [Ruminococcus sp.]
MTVILDDQTKTYSSSVKCVNVVHSTYQVTIPDKEIDLSKPVEFKVSAENVIIGKEQTLDIFGESVNNWKLIIEKEKKDTRNNEETKESENPEDTEKTESSEDSGEDSEEKVYIEYLLKPESVIIEKKVTEEESEAETEKVKTQEESGTEKIESEIFEVEDKTPLKEGKNNILSVQSEEAVDSRITKVLKSEVIGKAKIAGTYSDVLTFTVEINDKPVENESAENDDSGNKQPAQT